jgi:cytochrome b6-f complex iron-sulfur subunit
MSTETLILVGVAVVAILAAVGAFAIAYRRSGGAPESWRSKVSPETRSADRGASAAVVVEEPPPAPAEAVAPADDAEAVPAAEAREPVAVTVAETQRIVEVSPEEAGVTRRQFFNRALAGTFGAFLGGFAIYSLAFMWPKIGGGFGADVNAGPASDLRSRAFAADGSVVPVFIPEARAYLVPADTTGERFEERGLIAGGLMALYQRCVHLGCRVPWCGPSQGFECPCHGSKYSAIGEYFAGPAPRDLDRFVVEITPAGDFIIKTGSIIELPRAPELLVSYPKGPSCIGAIAGGEEEA